MSVEPSTFDVRRSAPRGAVFLSYASQDAGPARRICDALRAAGVEVWFDQSELRGGDAWDAKIRKQIKECALFVPVISANTQARGEGYFRLEWRLADRRTELMGKSKAFLLPVCIDSTPDSHADVPDSFVAVQWMRLPGGETNAAFCDRIKTLLAPSVDAAATPTPSPGTGADVQTSFPQARARRGPTRRVALGALVVLVLGAVVFVLRPQPRPAASGAAAARAASATAPSIATPVPQTEAQRLVAQMWQIYDRIDDVSSEEWALAQDLGAQATKLEPLNAEAWAAFAEVTLTPYIMGYDTSVTRKDRALKLAERATTLAPDATEPRLALANCYRFGDAATRTEAERIVRELVVREPANRRVLRMAGNVMRTQGKLDESVAFYDQANALPGGDAIALLSKEYTLKLAGRFAESEAALNESFALHAGPAAYVRRLFYLLYVYDDLDGAAEIAAKVPGPFLLRDEATWIVSSLWLWRRDTEKCVAVLRRFDGENLYGVPKGYLIGHAFEASGRMPAAELEWRGALQKVDTKLAAAPNDAHALYWKAYLLACLGERAEADRLLKIYEQLTSPAGDTLDFEQADILIRLGRNDEAIATLETAVRSPVRNLTDLEWRGSVRHDPIYDPLRTTPRFQALVTTFNASKSRAEPTVLKAAGSAALPSVTTADGSTPRSPSSSLAGSNPGLADSKSVAVLAFDNLSDDKANEYFSDGISEELISALGRVSGLTVKGSTSAFYFKHKEDQYSSAEIARQLGVTYLVRGSVRKAGDQVRITAQLTRAATDEVVWSLEPETREVKDVFAVQEEVARLIAQKLELKLNGTAAPKVAVNPEAYELYLQARQAWNLRNADGYDRAEKLLTQSIALAPGFAPAHAALVDVWAQREQSSISRWGLRNTPAAARIVEKGRQAIALGPASAEAHASLGAVWWLSWRFADAERELREAIRLNPNYASAHQWLGRTLMVEGRLDDALAELKQAAELDPLSPRILDNYSFALLNAQRPMEGLEMADRALRLQPNAEQPLAMKAVAFATLGESEAAAATARSLPPDFALHAEIAFVTAGQLKAAAALLPSIPENRLTARIAGLVGLGRTSEALATLKPEPLSSTEADLLLFNPVFDPLRSDPRFREVLKTVGLVEANDRAQAWRAAHPPQAGGRATEDGGRKK